MLPSRNSPRWPAESAALRTAGKPDAPGGDPRLAQRPHGGEGGLRHSVLGERVAHGDLVGHQMRDLAADAGQSELLGGGSDDRHGAVGRDGHDALDRVPAADVDDRVHVGEVDHLAHIGNGEPGASAFRSTATTRASSSRTRSIARCWCRPAPTNSTVRPFTAAMLCRCASW
jgi:hypothetical protein